MRRALLLVAALALLVTGCSGSSTGAGGNGTVKTVEVAVTNGTVVPKTHRVQVPKGDTVRLVVTTDTDDEVHVHGVDIEKETTAGKPTTLEFEVPDAGLYEVETHHSGLQLLQLEVR